MNDLGRMFEDSQHKRFEQLMDCIHEVQAWFKEEYKQHDLKVNVNARQGKTDSSLDITFRLLTDKQMANNQGLFQNKISIPFEKWQEPMYMDKLLISLVPSYKNMLINAINNHYNSEKEKEKEKEKEA